MARRRWQEGTVYLRKSKKLPDAWWGRFIETTDTGARIQRNIRLGDVRELTKPLAKRALREHVDRANNYRPQAVKVLQIGKNAIPFSVFAARWQEEVLTHKKASTQAATKSYINTYLLPEFGKLAMGDLDSESVQSFLNRLTAKLSAKSVKNAWTALRIMAHAPVTAGMAAHALNVKPSITIIGTKSTNGPGSDSDPAHLNLSLIARQ